MHTGKSRIGRKRRLGQLVNQLYSEVQAQAQARSPAVRQEVEGPNALTMEDAPAGEQVWDTKTLERAAYKGRVGSPKTAANILCGQAAVPAGPETTCKLRELICAPVPAGECEELQRQRDRGRLLNAERPLVVECKQVIASALNLHAAASPGPSGFRNS
jgi:hypothetical protein